MSYATTTLTITHIEKHILNLKFTPWTLSSGAKVIHIQLYIDSIIIPKDSGFDLESGSKSQGTYLFPKK